MDRNHIAYKTIKSYVAEGMSALEDNDCQPVIDALHLILDDFKYCFMLAKVTEKDEILRIKKEWLDGIK